MRRVYFSWFMKRVLPLFGFEVAFFIVVLASIQSYVSFGNVWQTATFRATEYSAGSFGWYVIEALNNTELAAKILLLSALALGWFAIRDTIRISKQFRRNLLRIERVI